MPDLRFIESGYELMMLREYIKLLEANIRAIIDREKDRIWADLDQADEADRSVGGHLEDRLTEGVTTRFFGSSIVMASWAIYEATVSELANHIRDKQQLELKMSDLRGEFLARARKYFSEVLNFPLHPATTDWTRLGEVAELRHALAHANGYMRSVQKDKRSRLRKWAEQTPGISIVDDEYLVVSISYARDIVIFIDALLDELIGRVRAVC